MGPKAYAQTKKVVEVIRPLFVETPTKDIPVYSLVDAMLKARDFA
jgi:hypothetical protein